MAEDQHNDKHCEYPECEQDPRGYSCRKWPGCQAAPSSVGEPGGRERALADALRLVLDDWANANAIGDDAREQAERALNAPPSSELPRTCSCGAPANYCKDCSAGDVRAAQSATAPLDGTWPKGDPRRAFVEGAKWWEYASDSATMWPADVDRAEAEAEKRYPYVEGKS